MDDTFFSLRLKHGVHTIFLFVDSHKTFSDMSSTLLEVLRQRYASGTLRRSINDDDATTEIPAADDDDRPPTIYYARLKNAHDHTQGWEQMSIRASDTPSRLGIVDNSMLAFSFAEHDFPVEFPQATEEEEE